MISKLSHKYEFNQRQFSERLSLLGLGDGDLEMGNRLQAEVIGPHVDEIIEDFYAILLVHPETRQFLADEVLVARLKRSQKQYLLSLGVNFLAREYCENRLVVGQAHSRVGLPLSIYACAYSRLKELILGHLPEHVRANDEDRTAMTAFLCKIVALDMSIASETYHQVEVGHLAASLDELRDEGEYLRWQATTDALTGIANRKHVIQILRHAIDEARAAGDPLAVLMIDLDFFKAVNDSWGHIVGDEVLTGIARRIMSALRDSDAVGRYGGEEFLAVLHETSLHTAMEIAERIRRKIQDSPMKVRSGEVAMTVSLGVAEARPEESYLDLVERADRALYAAKRTGRNRVVAGE